MKYLFSFTYFYIIAPFEYFVFPVSVCILSRRFRIRTNLIKTKL